MKETVTFKFHTIFMMVLKNHYASLGSYSKPFLTPYQACNMEFFAKIAKSR